MGVGAMHSVKVAHTDERGAKVGGYIVEFVEDLHAHATQPQISNCSLIPSKESRTSGGRAALVARCGKSWQIWVKNARCGFTRSTMRSEFSTVECVGCGLCRSASRNKMSKSFNCANDGSGISLKSVR